MTFTNNAIRLITEFDLDDVMSIETESYPHPWSLHQFSQEIENPVSSILVYEADERIVGYICFWLIVGEMQILNIATSSQFRRQGVAVQLLEEAFRRCSQVDLSSAWLEVRSGNIGAIALYQQYGFILSGTRKAYYRDGEDALVMVKTFNSSHVQEKV
ncbi:MAG: ribosomal protein S18-alanine N-acetyltransferase [Desulfuromusa sp.]|jgi:ribosomal-protein-alanine N-acetyltransferase|nr:ribosomal protein S18-alanine N-acetyltransferase [Desulfuromusa sp.]